LDFFGRLEARIGYNAGMPRFTMVIDYLRHSSTR